MDIWQVIEKLGFPIAMAGIFLIFFIRTFNKKMDKLDMIEGIRDTIEDVRAMTVTATAAAKDASAAAERAADKATAAAKDASAAAERAADKTAVAIDKLASALSCVAKKFDRLLWATFLKADGQANPNAQKLKDLALGEEEMPSPPGA